MKKIIVSGLVNTETTVKVSKFPIEYFPIDYPFFGVNTDVSGVAYNVAKALKTLGDDVDLFSMVGTDIGGEYISKSLNQLGISDQHIKSNLKETPNTVVLYDEVGKRQIYCDLKDIQDQSYDFTENMYENCDAIIACNANFNRPLLQKAKIAGKIIATDVHVLSDIDDSYNNDFMRFANILFLSDENIKGDVKKFIISLCEKFQNEIIVLGRGSKGAMMYVKMDNKFYDLPAVKGVKIVNTVGAGDALFSAFVHYYVGGFNPEDALKRAQIFAAIKIGCNGAANGFASEKEVETLYQKEYLQI